MDKENASGVLRSKVIIIPRDWVRPIAEFPLGVDSSMDRHDRDKVGDKPKLEPEEMHHVYYYGDDKDVDGIMLKLQRGNYYAVPPMEELISKEKEEVGFVAM